MSAFQHEQAADAYAIGVSDGHDLAAFVVCAQAQREMKTVVGGNIVDAAPFVRDPLGNEISPQNPR